MMTTATASPHETLIADYSDAWESRDADRIASFHAEDGAFQLHSGAGEAIRGRAAIRDAFAGFIAQFPDLTFTEQELRQADWGWTVRWTMSGTLGLSFPVGDRTVKPGARFAIDALDLITVDSEGTLAAKHTYLDWRAALDQLGLA